MIGNVLPVLLDITKLDSSSENSPEDHGDNSSNSVYTKYDNLMDHYQNCMDFNVVFKALLSNADSKHNWKVHFELIEHLRTLNKFHYMELCSRLILFTDFIIQCIDNLRSNVSKDALLFLKEVLPSYKIKELPGEFLSKITPVLVDKSISDKAFIKTEAKKVLKELETYCADDVTIVALSHKCFDKNVIICEIAFQTLTDLIKHLGDNLQYRLTLGGCKTLFKTILKALEGKRMIMKKCAESLWLHLKQILGSACDIESFLEVKICLSKADIAMLMRISPPKIAAPRPNFQNFVKERKMMLESNINVDNTQNIQEEFVPIKHVLQHNFAVSNSNRMEIITGKENQSEDEI